MIHVAAAVIANTRGEVLISRRPEQVHQGGLWEFPGGKLEPGETVYQGLQRELHEELGLEVQAARPLIRVPHQYPDKAVLLDVWQVTKFSGEAHGREGQPVRWVPVEQLVTFEVPAANRPIVSAARLPDRYLITPEPAPDFLDRLEHAFARGLKLVQLRAKTLDTAAYTELAQTVCRLAADYSAQVLLNAEPALVRDVGAAGVHLTSDRLLALPSRPLPPELWVAASCHSVDELAHAARIGVDFAVVGPVQPTASHPGQAHLGWAGLRSLTEAATLPVFALGGVGVADIETAWNAGAQGIAAIRDLWSGE